eukprot:TRINITY_DN110117_c0_g1_i1.p2 TRINITY_DN110117_c0_g1~~TRINITY_DN110117_c0_g1_i1.p2  ORF type:complete len:114 (-),score=16.08 TRINITY_DN110117_c0_g1_i1:36-377(-)
MVLTMLGRTAARASVVGRSIAKAPPATLVTAPRMPQLAFAVRHFAGYDYNIGIPGSRIKNPDPKAYNDLAPSFGFGWWALIVTSSFCWLWGNTYDASRGICVAIGLFGPNMPL